jgi:hypothetical protein
MRSPDGGSAAAGEGGDCVACDVTGAVADPAQPTRTNMLAARQDQPFIEILLGRFE